MEAARRIRVAQCVKDAGWACERVFMFWGLRGVVRRV
jgi:hypothetical protein